MADTKIKRWAPPGWPWELELLALVFVIMSIVVPYYLQTAATEHPTREMTLFEQAEMARKQQVTGSWQEQVDFIWAIAIICLYLAHVVMGWSSINFVSTPFTHLLAPVLFSGITYYRLFKLTETTGVANPIVHGNPVEMLMWGVGVVVITVLVARIRMARHMLNFRDVTWEVNTPTVFDSSYPELMLQLQPLIYPPRIYRASGEGLMVEGWLYVMPIPYSTIHSIDAINKPGFLSNGYYLATSTRNLVRIQLAESAEPVFISPVDRDVLLRYCRQHVVALKPETKSVALVDAE
jgi:hypothetical protein